MPDVATEEAEDQGKYLVRWSQRSKTLTDVGKINSEELEIILRDRKKDIDKETIK